MIVEWKIPDEELPIVEPTGIDGLMSSDYILLSFINYPLIAVGRYDMEADGSGAFYLGDDKKSCTEQGLFVNAWMPIIPPYRDDKLY